MSVKAVVVVVAVVAGNKWQALMAVALYLI
jgi:hypothetical protein